MADRFSKRLRADLLKFHNDPPQGIYLDYDECNFTEIHALIIGPKNTPYEGGFFYFKMDIPNDYPHSPPKVLLKTTGNGSVRFNPNLYQCGKVCLSILGTWSGPGWTPIMSVSTVFISIQSLLNEEPYYNEPGYENTKNKVNSDEYNKNVRFNTMKYAVVDVLEKRTILPEKLYTIAKQYFIENFLIYKDICHRFSYLNSQTTKIEFLKNFYKT